MTKLGHSNQGLMKRASLENLNKLDGIHTQLLILRAMNTSDLAFHYMIFDESTTRDIVEKSLQMYRDNWEELSLEEREEYIEYCKNMVE